MVSAETRLWHPFSDMARVRGHEVVLVRGEDVWVWDAEGRRYLDATASLWYANVGHGRRAIADAVHAQLLELETYSAFGDYANEPALALAARLAELAPVRDGRVFLTTGGGEAVDTAAKLVRRYWTIRGQPERMHLIGRTGAYHGTGGYGTSVGGIEPNRAGFGPLMGGTSLVPHDSLPALEAELRRVGPERVAAVLAEPVLGAGGVHPPPPGYLEGVAALCEEHGALLVMDEVICAFGRLGRWFGCERWGLEPDLVVFAKGVTSGYLPLGGVVASGEVAEPFWSRPGTPLRHGATYAAHATCCAAALANLELLAAGLVARGEELEGALLDAVAPLNEHPLVAEVRGGVGLMAAVEIAPAHLRGGDTVAEVFAAARSRGVLVRALGSAIALSPPLTIAPAQLDEIGGTLREALDEVAAVAV
jgi:adenosylmethionine-8-amino-7-oxononanoate aminotransferase